MFRCYTKKLRQKSSDSECLFCLSCVPYLLPSLTDPEQCRQSMASMVFEGMHIAAVHVLVKVFQGYPVVGMATLFCSLNFVVLFAYIRYMDCCSMDCFSMEKGIHQMRTPGKFLVYIQIDVSFSCIWLGAGEV